MALQQSKAVQALSESSANGAVILGRCDKPTFTILKKKFKNICYVGLNYFKQEYDQVICDGMEASKAAVNYLINLGHTKIGISARPWKKSGISDIRNAMIEKKLSTESRYVANVLLSYEGGYNGAKKLLSCASDITAVFCANDITAVGAMRAFQESGLSIPKDISRDRRG